MRSGRKRYRWKGGKQKTERDLYYRDQLQGAVSYGICRTKCHVALLHWDSASRKSRTIIHTEREGKEGNKANGGSKQL